MADGNNDQIQSYNLNTGAPISATAAGTGTAGSSTTALTTPSDVYVDQSGNIYVVDSGNSRIQKFPSGSTTASTIAGSSAGDSGNTPAELNYPTAFAFDSGEAYFWVTDTFNDRVLNFSTTSTAGTSGTLAAVSFLFSSLV